MYGLLGKKLGHSFSKLIHEHFTNQPYSLIETDEVDIILKEKNFKGLNVTIPYKKDVIPFLDEVTEEAERIGVVNTIHNVNGKLVGYNTDYYGVESTLKKNNISVEDKEVIIIGNGSTSKTMQIYCQMNKAKSINVIARNPKDDEHNILDYYKFTETTVLFNATPVGMFPRNYQDLNIDLSFYKKLEFVMDVVYNPLQTNLMRQAKNLGIKTENGLYMLISQAIKAINIFHNKEISDFSVNKYYTSLQLELMNLVFIGMPMSGKSFISRKIAEKYNKTLVELDTEIEKEVGISIPEIFDKHGEKHFRICETKQIMKFSMLNNQAISCGGGAIINKINVEYLKQNGLIIFLDVPLEILMKSNPKDRPLLKNRNNLEKLYKERYNLYKESADIIINKTTYDESIILKQIEVKLNEYFNS